MGFAPDGFYSFENFDGGYNGLVRVSRGGFHFERADDGGWVEDQGLARHFVNPDIGGTLERIDDATAQHLAERYGVTL
jgi:hypothetical protein